MPPDPLHYSTASQSHARRSRWFIWAVLLIVAAILMQTCDGFHWLNQEFWYRVCAAYTDSPTSVVLDESIGKPVVVAPLPLPYRMLLVAESDRPRGARAVVFLHGIPQVGDGSCVLVITANIGLASGQTLNDALQLETVNHRHALTNAHSAASSSIPMTFFPAGGDIPINRRLRVFAGQSDPKNPKHLMIPIEIDGQPRTIDGWVNGYGYVVSQVRPLAATLPATTASQP